MNQETAEKSFIIKEENYARTMTEEVVPYLKARQSISWPEREPGKSIYCETYQADDPRGMVVISHGFTESAEKYQEVIYYFLLNGYDVTIPDHCGHGRSYRLGEDLSLVHVDKWERYVSDLLYVAEAAHKNAGDLPMFLYGHSMGGGIAAAAAAKEPWLFKRVILNAPMITANIANLPMPVVKLITAASFLAGKKNAYGPGQHGFVPGSETFENSASTSRARFDWYQAKRESTPLLQTCAPSNGWLFEAADLSAWLLHRGCRQIMVPVLLFQAAEDAFVSNKAESEYIGRVNRFSRQPAKLVHVPASRHEIYNSTDRIQEQYWKKILAFLEAE